MNKKEKQLFDDLVNKEISITKVLEIYTVYLEKKDKDNNEILADNAVLLAVMKEPKLWMGTKKALQDKLDGAIAKWDLFNFTIPISNRK